MRLLLIALATMLPLTSAVAVTKDPQRAIHRRDAGHAVSIKKRRMPRFSYKRCMEIGLERGVSPNLKSTWCMMHGYNR